MSEEVRGIVVAHADLAQALVRTVERISGVEGALRAVSNEGLGTERLREVLAAEAGPGPSILFVDLGGGSCGVACLGLARGRPGMALLTGVNVPMLLDFVFHRDMTLDVLVERLLDKGRSEQRAHPAERPGGEPAAGG